MCSCSKNVKSQEGIRSGRATTLNIMCCLVRSHSPSWFDSVKIGPVIHNMNNFLLISHPTFPHSSPGSLPRLSFARVKMETAHFGDSTSSSDVSIWDTPSGQTKLLLYWSKPGWGLSRAACPGVAFVRVLEREILAAICSEGISPRPSLSTCCKSGERDKGNQKVTGLVLCLCKRKREKFFSVVICVVL